MEALREQNISQTELARKLGLADEVFVSREETLQEIRQRTAGAGCFGENVLNLTCQLMRKLRNVLRFVLQSIPEIQFPLHIQPTLRTRIRCLGNP